MLRSVGGLRHVAILDGSGRPIPLIRIKGVPFFIHVGRWLFRNEWAAFSERDARRVVIACIRVVTIAEMRRGATLMRHPARSGLRSPAKVNVSVRLAHRTSAALLMQGTGSNTRDESFCNANNAPRLLQNFVLNTHISPGDSARASAAKSSYRSLAWKEPQGFRQTLRPSSAKHQQSNFPFMRPRIRKAARRLLSKQRGGVVSGYAKEIDGELA